LKHHRPFITLAIALLLAACGGSDTFQAREMPISRITAWWQSTSLNERYVVRSESEWQAVWKLHEPPTLPASIRPSIDFSSTMVVGLTFGSGPNGCYGLSIRRAVEEEFEIRVEYLQAAAGGPGVLCTQAIVPLTDFVSVPRSDKHVVFVRIHG